ncbi:MAG: DUF6790 family protein [Solirubrobacterales bacterium]
MIFVFYAVLALAGATIHRWRDRQPRSHERTLEIYLVWWLAVTIGVGGIVGGLYHLFDGKDIAEQIGFTRGDGGFQTEVGFGDIAVGTIAFMGIWFRGKWWLAALIAAAISLWGDTYGHIYQAIEHGNRDVDNTGPVLFADFLYPLVGLALYALHDRLSRGRVTPAPNP